MLTLTEPTATRRPPRRRPPGLRRVAGITGSLVGTQALTSVLGLVFWTLAARTFAESDVGVAGAAVAMMMLLGSLGSLGLGTLLIARLPSTPPGQRRILVRTCLAAAGLAGALLAAVVPLIAVHVFGAVNLGVLVDTPAAWAGLVLGTGLFSVVLVLDQAVLTIGVGTLQLERNVLASVIKIGALFGLAAAGAGGGMAIFLAWTIGTLVSLPLVSWRTRATRGFGPATGDRRFIAPSLLKGLGRDAASHHALNITLQAALQILPILVTVLVTAQDNAYFNSAVLFSGFVFALPYAIAIGLFAAAGGDERQTIARMRVTIPVGLTVSLCAYLVLFPLAGTVLSVFGSAYADEGANILRALMLAGLPFVIKDHYVALRRVQGRTGEAVVVLGGFLLVELVAATTGALLWGTVGLCLAWVSALFVEAGVLAVPLARAWRSSRVAERQPSELPPAAELQPAEHQPATEMMVARSEPITATAAANESSTSLPRRRKARHRLVEPGHETGSTRLGRSWVPGAVVVVIALGVLAMAIAAGISRAEGSSGLAEVLWVTGLLLIFAPATYRVVLSSTTTRERLLLAMAVPIALQLSRLTLFPSFFAFHDELIHATTLRQIVESDHLFTENPLLPVSAFYPGMEIVTAAVHDATGLSLFASGIVVLMLARILLAATILGLGYAVTRSSRAAAVAGLVYVVNSQFLFFNSQYSYQTLALPLAIFTVYVFLTRPRRRWWAMALPIASLAMVAVTHHVTAVLLVAAFAVWLVVDLVLVRGRSGDGRSPVDDERTNRTARSANAAGLIAMLIAGAAFWLLTVAVPGNPVGSYLDAIVNSSATDMTSLSEGQQTKELFANTAGAGPAPWEQVMIIAAVLISAAALLTAPLFGRDRLRRRDALGVVLALLALLYPIIPGGHLTRATSEVGDRAAGFVFVGIATCVGWWVARRTIRRRAALLATVIASIAFLGNIILGAGPMAGQLPGPYLISADARSMDADNRSAAIWLATGVPAGSRVYADRVSGLLAAAEGHQFTVRHVSTGIDASRLLLDPEYTAKDLELIRQADLDYLIVDTRLAYGLPQQQVYVESGEFGGQNRVTPVPAAALQKFATVPGVQRIYDNGSLVVYDLRGLRDAG